MNKKVNLTMAWKKFFFWTAMLIALPFIIGTSMMLWDLLKLSSSIDNSTKALKLQSTLLIFGFTMGWIGTAFTLTSESQQRRLLGTATILFGSSHIALSVVIKIIIEQRQNAATEMLWLIIPLLLWVYSFAIAIRIPGLKSDNNHLDDQKSNEEQQ